LYASEILSKNWDIWNLKFQQNSIVSYFFFIFLSFLAFCFLFHVPKLVQKLCIFLWCFIGRVRYFTNDFWKILKVLLKRILICEIFFFSKFCSLLFGFLLFCYFWRFIFNFISCTCQKMLQIFMFFYFMDYRFYQRILENHVIFFKKI